MSDITLPQLGETVTEGTITEWFKHVGDTVDAGEPLFEVSTDKVDTEVPSPVAGVLTEIRAAEGALVEVGEIVAVVGDGSAPTAPTSVPEPAPARQAAPTAAPTSTTTSVPHPSPAPEPAADSAPEPTPPPAPEPARGSSGGTRLLSPVVRRLVNDHHLDPDAIAGSGAGGRVTRDDVLGHLDAQATPSPAPAPATEPEPTPTPAAAPAPTPASAPVVVPTVVAGERDSTIALSKIRRLTGDHMVMSKATSPHAFSVVEVDFANVDTTRSAVKSDFKANEGFSLTYLPFIARAIVDGLGEFPHLNASVSEDELVVHGYIDLAVAVDLDHEGLVAPIIRSAETKRLKAIAREISSLAERARGRTLHPDEISGGTFTISNNGSAGSVLSMPIINQPQVGIISTDAIVRKPVVTRTTDGEEAIAIRPVGNLAMSWDHRAFDGAYAAGFLKRVKAILESRDWSAEL